MSRSDTTSLVVWTLNVFIICKYYSCGLLLRSFYFTVGASFVGYFLADVVRLIPTRALALYHIPYIGGCRPDTF